MTSAPRRILGKTGFQVFPLNLGGNVFGWTADREASFQVLDAYREAGGNFIDTADVYSRWVPGHVGGESEAMIGAWLRSRACRDEVVLATKVGMGGPGIGEGLSAEQVKRGCEASLKRLAVDQVDLYYAHQDDAATPQEETMRAFDDLVRDGKVRAIGASNFSAERLASALDVSARGGLASYAVVQPEYNLVSRGALEGALAELCTARGLAVCTYFALAAGFLTGKYAKGETPTGGRAARARRYLEDPNAMARLEALRGVARKHGATPAQVALAWQLHRRPVTTPIASATSAGQVKELVASVLLRLDDDDMAVLDAA